MGVAGGEFFFSHLFFRDFFTEGGFQGVQQICIQGSEVNSDLSAILGGGVVLAWHGVPTRRSVGQRFKRHNI